MTPPHLPQAAACVAVRDAEASRRPSSCRRVPPHPAVRLARCNLRCHYHHRRCHLRRFGCGALLTVLPPPSCLICEPGQRVASPAECRCCMYCPSHQLAPKEPAWLWLALRPWEPSLLDPACAVCAAPPLRCRLKSRHCNWRHPQPLLGRLQAVLLPQAVPVLLPVPVQARQRLRSSKIRCVLATEQLIAMLLAEAWRVCWTVPELCLLPSLSEVLRRWSRTSQLHQCSFQLIHRICRAIAVRLRPNRQPRDWRQAPAHPRPVFALVGHPCAIKWAQSPQDRVGSRSRVRENSEQFCSNVHASNTRANGALERCTGTEKLLWLMLISCLRTGSCMLCPFFPSITSLCCCFRKVSCPRCRWFLRLGLPARLEADYRCGQPWQRPRLRRPSGSFDLRWT